MFFYLLNNYAINSLQFDEILYVNNRKFTLNSSEFLSTAVGKMFASPTCNKRTELRHAGAVKLARIMEFNFNILFFYTKLKSNKYYLIKNNKNLC